MTLDDALVVAFTSLFHRVIKRFAFFASGVYRERQLIAALGGEAVADESFIRASSIFYGLFGESVLTGRAHATSRLSPAR